MFAKAGPIEDPIVTPSICLWYLLLDVKWFFGGDVKQIMKIMLWDVREILVAILQAVNTISMVSSRGIFVNKESMSRLAMCKLGFCWQISSAKLIKLMTGIFISC